MTRAWVGFGAAAALVGSAVLLACSNRMASGGDATETGNARVAGVVMTEGGVPSHGAQVTILPADYDPSAGKAVPDTLLDTTDANGRYRFTRLADGEYDVLVRNDDEHTRLSIYGIRVAQDSVILPADTLHAPGAVVVPLPETADSGLGWIYIPGTQIRGRVDSEVRIAGAITLDSVPAGLVPRIEYKKADSASAPMVLARDVQVRKGEVTHVDAYAAWPHARKLIANTGSGVTLISKDMIDFPMLVRLQAPAFDFSQSIARGADVRFSSPGGMPLPYVVQDWDSAAGHADLWLRIDTLHARESGQAFTMHWGATTKAGPKARPVFDTATGFAGVWHLEEEAADTTTDSLYKDATGAGSDGDDRIRNTDREGVVGRGHGIDSGDYIVASKPANGVKLTSAFTLSIWFRSNGKRLGSAGGEVLNVGDNYGMRVFRDSGLHMWYWPPKPPTGAKTEWNYVSAPVKNLLDGNWHLIMGTFDGTALHLYCDGKEVGSSPAGDVVGLLFPLNVTMGKHGNGKPFFEFDGDLDEAQIHSRSRDADWAKLSFENQKPGAAFPAFGP